jgi:glycosyltransferase involved in cell wall biosynthesis
LDLEGYARQMRQSDVLLSLMLSPHPSYPPLEMAACGKPVVTTTYENKTAERLAAISPNIIGVPATIEAIADGLLRAMQRSAPRIEQIPVGFPKTWDESLSDIVPRLYDRLLELFAVPQSPVNAASLSKQHHSRIFPGYRQWPSAYYELLRLARLRERHDRYLNCDSTLFSLVTTVWNTAPEFVAELAESVFGQDAGADFEWVILDNGTSRSDTRSLLQEIAKHPAVRLHRVDENIGIVKGLRYCLDRAKNRYIVPLDSDDLLTPDCLRILASSLSAHNYPALAYTDEDKVSDHRFLDPYCKPDWDPVLFTHSCYIAHLCAIDRKLAIELGAYTNLEAEGSHDWDSFLRFWQAGHRPHHIPEVVYSWRMHPQSTSGNIKSKSYIHASQLSVLNRFVSGSPKAQDYKVELSPLFDGAPDWRFVPTRNAAPSIPTILYDAGLAQAASEPAADHNLINIAPRVDALLIAAKQCAARGEYVHLQSASVAIDDAGWPAEAVALMDLFGDTAMVGGRIHDGTNIIRADGYFGFGDGCDSPNAGRSLQDPGYFAQMWKPHSANAIPIEHCVLRTDFLVDALSRLSETGIGFSYLGAWLGAIAKARGLRVVYSPFLSALAQRRLDEAPALEKSAFRIAWARFMPDTELLSPRLGLTKDTTYLAISREMRSRQERGLETSSIEDQTAEAIASRVIAKTRKLEASSSPTNAGGISFSLITTVWDTDPRYVSALADSVAGQDCEAAFEWIILDNGSVRPETVECLSRLSQLNFVRLSRVEQNVGIVAGLRHCLERAVNEYIIPIDSDDILTPDAFRRLVEALKARARPAYIFSDEDILENTRLRSPIKRSDFDPILNTCDSYVWHLCAFQRSKALQVSAYTDAGAEYCHDWDTITRFADAGEVIQHVPHVLYHWRTHAQSSSNSGSLNSGSMQSTKWLLERTIARQQNPALYEVRLFPISRGVDQYAIMRKPVSPLRLCLLYLGEIANAIPSALAAKLSATTDEKFSADFRSLSCPEAQSATVHALLASDSDAVVVATQGCDPRDESGIWEAMLLLELHADVAAAAGRITDERGKVLSACTSAAAAFTETPSWVGMSRTDPGPYALALKRQTATTIPPDFFVCRMSVLREALASSGGRLVPLVERIATIARSRGMRLAYSPLIEAIKTS